MSRHLERYRNGKCEAVWRELGIAAERDPGVLATPDFEAVMRETFGRVRRNVETIVERLRAIGYPFASEHDNQDFLRPPLSPAGEEAAFSIDCLNRSFGGCPAAIEWFSAVVGEVDLRQSRLVELDSGDDDIILEHLGDWDPLCFSLALFGAEFRSGALRERIADGFSPALQFAPDAYHKAGYSGADDYMIDLPAALVDPTVQMRGWTFMTYLRQCISSGGFAGAVVQVSDRTGTSLTLYENAFDVSLPEHPIFDLLAENLEMF